MDLDETVHSLVTKLNSVLDHYAPIRDISLDTELVNDLWVTTGLLKSFKTCTKLYHSSIQKGKDSAEFNNYK